MHLVSLPRPKQVKDGYVYLAIFHFVFLFSAYMNEEQPGD